MLSLSAKLKSSEGSFQSRCVEKMAYVFGAVQKRMRRTALASVAAVMALHAGELTLKDDGLHMHFAEAQAQSAEPSSAQTYSYRHLGLHNPGPITAARIYNEVNPAVARYYTALMHADQHFFTCIGVDGLAIHQLE